MANLLVIAARKRQRGLTLMELTFILSMGAVMAAIAMAAISALESGGGVTSILRTSSALMDAGQALRASGNFTLVRQRAGIPSELYSGTAGVAVQDAVVSFATDRIGTNGALGVWVEYRSPELCLDVARQAAQRFGRVFVANTEVGGLSGLAARGSGVTSNPLQLTDSAIDLLCRSGVPPRRVRIYEH